MLQQRGFLPSSDKVKILEFHPVQPWVALASVSDSIAIWDWSTQQVVHEVHMGGADEEAAQEVQLNRLAEKDAKFISNPSVTSVVPSKAASGHVRQVRFLDSEVAYWHMATQHIMMEGVSSSPPKSSHIKALEGLRLLCVVCDNKVVLQDIISKKAHEVPRSVLEGKGPTCVEFLFRGGPYAPVASHPLNNLMTSPVLAFGCSDGSVRLVLLEDLRIIGKLSGSHKGSLTVLRSMPLQGQPRECLLAGDSLGGLHVWEPFSRPLTLADKEAPPKFSFQAHDKEVCNIVLATGMEEVDKALPRFFTSGMDNRVAAWDAVTIRQELFRVKLESKMTALGMAYSPRYMNAAGAANLLIASGSPLVLAMHTLTGSMRPVANLQGLIPAGTKKIPKTYVVAMHPTHPDLVAVGANTGMAFMAFERVFNIPATMPPLASISDAHISPSRAGADGGEGLVGFYMQLGDGLFEVAAQPETIDMGEGPLVLPRIVSRQKIAHVGGQSNRAVLCSSASGDYLALVWPATCSYSVYYRTMSGAWSECDKGTGVAVVWHSHKDMFAVLEEPQLAQPVLDKKAKKKAPDAAALKAAMEAAQAVAAAGTKVQIKSLDGMVASLVCRELRLGGNVPCALFGGPLLAVAVKRAASNAEAFGEEGINALQLVSWDSQRVVGAALAEPTWLSWDPTLTMVALGYPQQVVVFRVRPVFEAVATLSLPASTGAAWAVRQLYIVTPSSVELAFVSAPAPDPASLMIDGQAAVPPAVQVVTLATFHARHVYGDVPVAPAGGAVVDTQLPVPLVRPPGPLTMLGVRDGNLWLLTAQGMPVVIPLQHPGLRARCLAALGDLQGSLQLARATLSRKLHDGFAAFLIAMGGPGAAAVALKGLPGLTVEMEAELAVLTGQWRRALACCEALVSGCREKKAQQGADGVARRSVAPERDEDARIKHFSRLVGDRYGPVEEEQEQQQEQQQDTGPPPMEQIPITDDGEIDWDACIAESAKPPAAADAAADAESADGPDAAAAKEEEQEELQPDVTPSQRSIALTFSLADESMAAGMLDVSKAALRLLLQQRKALLPQQVARLAARLAEAGLKKELGVLARSQGATITHLDEAAGLLAAALAGDLVRLQRSLQRDNSLALAALEAATYRLSCAHEAERNWNAALKAVSEQMAPGKLTNYAYYAVTQM